MLDWRRFYYSFLNIPLRLLIKSKIISVHALYKKNTNPQKPIIYVLPYNSKIDLLILRIQCLQQGLPDPLAPIAINGITLLRYIFINDGPNLFSKITKSTKSIMIFHSYLNLHRSNPKIDVQIISVLVMIGRFPRCNIKQKHFFPYSYVLECLKRLFTVLWLGRDSFLHFSNPISMRYILTKYGRDKKIIKKLIRASRIYFIRQQLVVAGPCLPVRRDLFDKLLDLKIIKKSIEVESRNKKISKSQSRKNAIYLMKEISANVSYKVICLSDKLLSWMWNRLYQGLHVHNIDRVRQLVEDGKEIIYIPCHRSHMDYLLLSYVLYHQGLVPPHIAAGINLNFWPVGFIIRRLGAFFIRRSFNGTKLYSTIFQEYLGELINRGCPIEYFIEGGRSRTGRLLNPKTGMLTMTIKSMLHGRNRPISLMPIYIGYEHVIEVSTYTKELRGSKKEKESLFQMIKGLRKLRNLGQGYVNFGEPLSLVDWLNNEFPKWQESVGKIESYRPSWLAPAVDKIAFTLMMRINNSTATNAINLCSVILLSSNKCPISRTKFIKQLNCYLGLLRNVPYSKDVTVPNLTAETMLNHALTMNKFTVKKESFDDVIFLSPDQVMLMTYYRNNIQHLLILPSLLASIINVYYRVHREKLIEYIMLIYPLLKAELFMRFDTTTLLTFINGLIIELYQQGLIKLEEPYLKFDSNHSNILKLMASNIREILQRYSIIFFLLRDYQYFDRSILEKNSRIIANKLSMLYGIHASELFDKTVFTTLLSTLRSEGYISNDGVTINKKVENICNLLSLLLSPESLTATDISKMISNIKIIKSSY